MIANVLWALWWLLLVCAIGYWLVDPKKPAKTDQTCFIYCHECRAEMISSDSYTGADEDYLECFKCQNCGAVSRWDFGPPCPIRIPSDKLHHYQRKETP